MNPADVPDLIADAIERANNDEARSRLDRKPKPGSFWASHAGKQARRVLLEMLEAHGTIPQQPFRARTIRVFDRGDQAHDRLRDNLLDGLNAWGTSFLDAQIQTMIPRTSKGEDEQRNVYPISVPCSLPGAPEFGWHIVQKPDGWISAVNYRGRVFMNVMLELKTVNDLGWSQFLDGEIDPGYLAQAAVGVRAMNLNGTPVDAVLFIAEKKDTQHLAQIMVSAASLPFEAVLETTRAVAEWIERRADDLRAAGFDDFDDLEKFKPTWPRSAEGDREPDEGDRQLAIEGAQAAFWKNPISQQWPAAVLEDFPACSGKEYGWQELEKPSYVKTAGDGKNVGIRRKLGWRCSYCNHTARCFPFAVTVLSGRGSPMTIPEHLVPANAVVLAWGHDVQVKDTWTIVNEE